MVELNGTLADIGLPSIVRLLGELRETGLLRITSGAWTAELVFNQGKLISAAFGQERGLEALSAAVLMLGNGDFAFVEGGSSVTPDIDLAPDELYRRLDELTEKQNGQSPLVPSLDAVPRLEAEGVPSADQVVLERGALQVLLHIDGQRTVRSIIGDGPVVPALRSLAVLVQQGLITIESPDRPATPEKRPAPRDRAAPPPPAPPVPVPEPAAPQVAQPEDGILGVCPRLGFADDAARHYPRPTALHRCYASGIASLVTSQEQRELCLGGRYLSCPRFVAAPSVEPSPGVTPSTSVVPPGVAARMAVARTMTVADKPDEEDPSWIGSDEPPKGRRAALSRLRREPLFIAGGAVLGLLIVLGSLAALPMLQPRLGPSTPTAAPAFTAATTSAPARNTPPVVADTPAATAASIARPTTAPTTPPRQPTPTTGQLTGAALLDTRFASGAQKDWLDNPPFAGWRDGAYRLFARQATRFVAVSAPIRVPDDVLVSATMRKTGGPPGGGYGVIVRNQTTEALNGTNQAFDAYVLETGDLGEFGVWRRDGDRWVDLVPWMRSPAVRQGGSPNDITVRVIGTQLLLTINGIEVARVDDDVLAHGGVGVFAGGDNNEVALDRFTVQVPN
jgi:hypothetical protein